MFHTSAVSALQRMARRSNKKQQKWNQSFTVDNHSSTVGPLMKPQTSPVSGSRKIDLGVKSTKRVWKPGNFDKCSTTRRDPKKGCFAAPSFRPWPSGAQGMLLTMKPTAEGFTSSNTKVYTA